MRPLTSGTETILRQFWRRSPTGRFFDLGSIDLRLARVALRLGLVELKQSRGRQHGRLTTAGRYYARLLVYAETEAQLRSFRIDADRLRLARLPRRAIAAGRAAS